MPRPPQTHQSVPLLQLLARGDPSRRDDVCAASTVAAERRGTAVRARYRPVQRDCADVMEPVRADVRRRHPPPAGEPDEGLQSVALAPRRDVRESQWRGGLPVARSRTGGRDPRELHHENSRKGSRAHVHEEDAEAEWIARKYHHRRATLLQACDQRTRQCRQTGDRPKRKQPGRK